MGVISDIQETPGSGSTSSDGDSGGAAPEQHQVQASIGPFVQNYETEKFKTDSEDVQQMLTGLIAVANLM